ncbi:MAG: hypothetical protein HYS13_13855 [Planctomycetia bacterium]|nr:hypothetical protein [Planctomycetia bacterium]
MFAQFRMIAAALLLVAVAAAPARGQIPQVEIPRGAAPEQDELDRVALIDKVEQADPVFSGPQPGEKLPGFKMRGVFDDAAGKETDPVAAAGKKPIVVIFVHELTRPSLAVFRTVMNYAATREKDLSAALVFLGDDATETENRLKQSRNALPKDVPIGISVDGKEGPGALGLNRQVSLTVIVAKEGKVTASFALVQPSLQADGPKILEAIVKQAGGKAPTLEELGVRQPAESSDKQDPNLRGLLAPVIRKDAKPEDVAAAIEKLETYLKEHPATRVQVGDIARRIIGAGKLEDYGTPPAREFLKKAAEKFVAERKK